MTVARTRTHRPQSRPARPSIRPGTSFASPPASIRYRPRRGPAEAARDGDALVEPDRGYGGRRTSRRRVESPRMGQEGMPGRIRHTNRSARRSPYKGVRDRRLRAKVGIAFMGGKSARHGRQTPAPKAQKLWRSERPLYLDGDRSQTVRRTIANCGPASGRCHMAEHRIDLSLRPMSTSKTI